MYHLGMDIVYSLMDLKLSIEDIMTYAEHNHVFQSMGVWNPIRATVTGIAEPEQVRVVTVSAGVLETLGVPPALGRPLLPADQVPIARPGGFNGISNTVMLSYGYWQRRFGGDRSVIKDSSWRASTSMGSLV